VTHTRRLNESAGERLLNKKPAPLFRLTDRKRGYEQGEGGAPRRKAIQEKENSIKSVRELGIVNSLWGVGLGLVVFVVMGWGVVFLVFVVGGRVGVCLWGCVWEPQLLFGGFRWFWGWWFFGFLCGGVRLFWPSCGVGKGEECWLVLWVGWLGVLSFPGMVVRGCVGVGVWMFFGCWGLELGCGFFLSWGCRDFVSN